MRIGYRETEQRRRAREQIIALMEKDLEWASPNVAQYVENLIKLIRKMEDE